MIESKITGSPMTAFVDTEALYRSVIDAVSVIVFRTDKKGRWTFLSPAWQSLTGLEPARCLGDASLSMMHPDDRAGASRTFVKLRNDAGGEYRHGARYRDAAGQWRWAQARMRSSIAADGSFDGSFGTIVDINTLRIDEIAHVESKERLSEANRRLMLAESIAHVGHWRTDATATHVDWSDETYRIFGFEDGRELNVATAINLYHPEDRQLVTDALAALQADHHPMSIKARILRDDGSLRHVAIEGRAERDGNGQITELCGVCKDITKYVETDAALRESELRYRLLAENITDLILCYGADGICQYASPAIAEITGFTTEQVIGIDVVAGVHRDDRARIDQQIAELVAGDVERSVAQYRWRHRDGQWLWLEARSRLMQTDDDAPPTIISVVRDTSDRHALECDLIAAKELAEAGGRAKADFLAMMSHELRTPMTGVLGMIDLLRLDPTPAERDRYFETLESSAKTMMLVVDDILDYSKVEAGKLSLEMVDFDVVHLANDVVAMFSHAASKSGVTINLFSKTGPHSPYVRGDPTRIRQVLSNLVSNAAKFTERGSIDVSVMPLAESGTWRFAVKDSGIGMSDAEMARLFEAFAQADGSTTRRFGGTGLGLAICKRLVVAMGGDIGVESEPGTGSTFWFELSLPVGAEPIDQTPTANAAFVPGGVALSILLAEDNPVNQLLVTSMVAKMGHTVSCVGNGALAVEAARSGRFDIILMDMQMPVMDGPEATQAIRKLALPASAVPIVALTADALMRRPEIYEPLGLTGYLAKPVNAQLLRHALDLVASAKEAGGDRNNSVVDNRDASSDLAVFDEAQLADMRRDLDPATVDHLLVLFARDLATQIALLPNDINLQNLPEARRAAHAIKGAAGNMAALRLQDAAHRAEVAIEGQFGDAVHIVELRDAVLATTRWIGEKIGKQL